MESSLHRRHKILLCLSMALLFGGLSANAQVAPSTCGSLHAQGQYGPYDYRTDKDKLGIVEGAHFTPAVESLIRGVTSVFPSGDIDYTLRAFPNHHRALVAMMRSGEKTNTMKPRGAIYTVECYFDRAIRFSPDDPVVRMIYATFLAKNGRAPEALNQLEAATTHAKDNPFTHHNIGLVYFDLREHEKALFQAHRAVGLGYTNNILVTQLKGAGKWAEAPEGTLDSSGGGKASLPNPIESAPNRSGTRP